MTFLGSQTFVHLFDRLQRLLIQRCSVQGLARSLYLIHAPTTDNHGITMLFLEGTVILHPATG
jgi:hypothetical protein